MRTTILCIVFLYSLHVSAQIDFVTPFKDCQIEGSTSIYDYKNKKWILSDSKDAQVETLPASTFKIINLFIALETGVIKDENEVVKWVGTTDTTLYGYRPDIYKDMTVKEAFEVSAGWVFIELAKKIGKERYKHYLKLCKYGNQNLSQKDADFWNFGAFAISTINQIEFMTKVYEEKVPFSKRNIEILKRVMITEKTDAYTIRSKTGWTRVSGNDIGWWVGYVERNENVYFFATRIIKKRSTINKNFGQCRKDITKNILRQLKAIE
ncbi:penicillin-binding transpeptidase domain-containing protein [Emticicia sp. C21]|uniref:penicillin-binding transpeptidase domain-containing protein n=1 Tax=Emticicia sp. C21 TaxID=2302915 RepID=UPI000E3503E7|nr:penicillin-binding transpeptidase domain-containing protein [Emticicia sp. C21]RFS13722.1 class D beta-lactamase [Emticicia sp. C21]